MDKHPAYQGLTRFVRFCISNPLSFQSDIFWPAECNRWRGLCRGEDSVHDDQPRGEARSGTHQTWQSRLQAVLRQRYRADAQKGNQELRNLPKQDKLQMFIRFYETSEDAVNLEADPEEFVRRVVQSGRVLSPAQIQGHFLLHKHSPKTAIDTIDSIRQ